MKKVIGISLTLLFASCYLETDLPGPNSRYLLPPGTITDECSCYYYPSEVNKVFRNTRCLSGYDKVGSCYICCDTVTFGTCFPTTYRYCL